MHVNSPKERECQIVSRQWEMSMAKLGAGVHRRPQRAHPERTPSQRPFVGNECVDDNLEECVKLMIWKVAGSHVSAAISVDVRGDTVRLSGELATDAERTAACAAARTVRGIAAVEDRLSVRGTSTGGPAEFTTGT
jgi:osmotically-inducible protein OsmY